MIKETMIYGSSVWVSTSVDNFNKVFRLQMPPYIFKQNFPYTFDISVMLGPRVHGCGCYFCLSLQKKDNNPYIAFLKARLTCHWRGETASSSRLDSAGLGPEAAFALIFRWLS